MRKIGVGPNWYRNGSTEWDRRHPVAIDAVTGTSSGTVDVTFAIPANWDDFWTNVTDTTNGYDIIVTGSDGRTILSFDLSGFSYANRTCTVRIDGLVLADTGRMEIVWLYWQSAQASNLGAVVTITSAISGYIELGEPPREWTVRAQPVTPGATIPEQRVSKNPSDILHIWWDVSDLLLARPIDALHARTTGYEGIDYAVPSVEPAATSAVTAAQTRYLMAGGRLYVRTQHTGGTDATEDTAYLFLLTKAGGTGSTSRSLYSAVRVVIEDAV